MPHSTRAPPRAMNGAAAFSASHAPGTPAVPAASDPVKVTFAIRCKTQLGESVCILGSAPELGAWDASSAVEMTWTEDHVWRAEVAVAPGGQVVECKALVVSGNKVTWEKGDNHKLTIAAGRRVDCVHDFRR